jgi:hypothetical protein
MKFRTLKAMLAATALLASGTAAADIGAGVKAGTLGLGLEARWDPPVPWFDLRVGVNSYDYSDKAGYAGVDYEATLALDSYYLTTNFKFPASPFRLTLGAFSNGNEVQLASQDLGGADFSIGGSTFLASDVGTLESVTSFSSTSPYLGFGFDFELFGKAGLNLDFGFLWQGEPQVTLDATGLNSAPAQVQDLLGQALEVERQELEDEMSNLKAWPVISLAFVYNF